MKKFLFMMIALALTVFAGCEKEHVTPEANEGAELFSIAAEIVETKVSYDDETLKVGWENTDELYALGFDASYTYVGKSIFKVSANTEEQTIFQGYGVKGARFYKFARVTPSVEISATGEISFKPVTMVQQDGNTCNAGKYIDYFTTGFGSLTPDYVKHIYFDHGSSIMRFDVQSYPEGMGEIKSVKWLNNLNQYNEKSRTLMLTESPAPGKAFSVWFVFDGNSMYLSAGQEIALELIGTEKIMRATATSAGGKVYMPGERYHATVSATPMAQALCNWTEVSPYDGIVRVKTVDNVRPADCIGFTLSEQMNADGYWEYVYEGKVVTEIPTSMFSDRNDIVDVILPTKAETIGNSAFMNCKSLQKISGLQSVKRFEADAFNGCTALTLELPSHSLWIGSEAFIGCKISSTVIPIIENSSYTEQFKSCEFVNSEIRLAEGSKEVSPNMFHGSKGPENLSLYIPDSVTKIGQNAVADSDFTRIDGMKEVTTIESGAFRAWKSKKFTIPAKVKNLGSSVLVDSSVEEVRMEVGTDCVLESGTFNGIGRTVPCKLILNEAWKDQPNGPRFLGVDGYSWMSGIFRSMEYVKM